MEEIGKTYKVNIATRHGNLGSTNAKDKVRQGSRAVKHVTTENERVGGARDLSIVGLDDGGGEVDEGCAGVSNADDTGRGVGRADAVTGRGELPVTGELRHGRVGQRVGKGLVNETKVVRAGCFFR